MIQMALKSYYSRILCIQKAKGKTEDLNRRYKKDPIWISRSKNYHVCFVKYTGWKYDRWHFRRKDSKFEDIVIEIIQNETHRRKRLTKKMNKGLMK